MGFFEHRVARSITRRRLARRMQRLKKRNQRRRFRRTQIFAVRRHVAAALQDLAVKLIFRETRGDVIQGGSAQTANFFERMAIAALLLLENDCALAFQWRSILQKL